jgi:hypothetical protein
MAQRRIVASPPAPTATRPAAPAAAAAPAASAAAPAASPAPAAAAKKVSLSSLFTELDKVTGDGRMDKVKSMLRADRFQLFSEVSDERVTGVVKSQTDHSLFYACSIDARGRYMCCTQNLNVCGGLRGKPCKHLLVLLVGLAQGAQVDPATALNWVRATRGKKAALDKDSMSATFIRYKGAEAGEVDWRPTETIPEDYYAF